MKKFLKKISGNSDEARQQTADQLTNHQGKIGRSKNHVSIVLVGPTGAGKTSTIKHLIGHNGDIELDSLRTSKESSETRETVELLLRIRKKHRDSLVNNVSLSIIDTPGFEDTDGPGQDARNICCIKRFFAKHGRDPGTGKPILPNLVIFAVKGDGARDIGPFSQFARCMRQYVDWDMGLTDGTNLVIVLTHAMNIERDEKLWPQEAKAKVEAVKKFARELTNGWDIPVVLLDNKAVGMRKVSDWTRFPDKITLQPKNLFDAISDVFDRNDDIFGRMLIQEYFRRERNDSHVDMTVGQSMGASLDRGNTREDFTQEEQKIYTELCGGIALPDAKTSSMHRVATWEKHREPRKERGDSQEEEEEDASKEVRDKEEEDFVPLPPESLRSAFSLGKRSQSSSNNSRNNDSLDEAMRCNEYFVGKGYDIKNKVLKEVCILKVDVVRDNVKRIDRAESLTQSSEGKNRVTRDRTAGLEGGATLTEGLTGNLRCKTGGKSENFDANGGWTERIILAKVMFKPGSPFDFRDARNLSDAFVGAVSNLPDAYKREKKNERKKFEKFFSDYGQGLARIVYLGGEATYETLEKEEADDATSDKGVGMNAASYAAKGDVGTRGSHNNSVRRTSTKVHFRGGIQGTHGKDKVEEWKKSLDHSPHAFVNDLEEDVLLHHDLLRMVEGKKGWRKVGVALEEAYDDMFTENRKEVVEGQREKDKGLIRRAFGWFV